MFLDKGQTVGQESCSYKLFCTDFEGLCTHFEGSFCT